MAKKPNFLGRLSNEFANTGLIITTSAAINWLRSKVNDLRMNIGAKRMLVNASSNSLPIPIFNAQLRQFAPGQSGLVRMYFFFYDPKTKDRLPYYDTFPLVIPIARYDDGFLGLNLHYIKPGHRQILLNKFEITNRVTGDISATNTSIDPNIVFRIHYKHIKYMNSLYMARPCIKRYLYSHVRSKFLEIPANQWRFAVPLPFESFKKQSKEHVWSQSQQKY